MKSFQTGIVILSIILTAAAASAASSSCANSAKGNPVGQANSRNWEGLLQADATASSSPAPAAKVRGTK